VIELRDVNVEDNESFRRNFEYTVCTYVFVILIKNSRDTNTQ
jgi:hypothetical protein